MTTTIKLTTLAISTMSIALITNRTATVCGGNETSKPFAREVARVLLEGHAFQSVGLAAQEIANALDSDGAPLKPCSVDKDVEIKTLSACGFDSRLTIKTKPLLTGFVLPW